MVVVFFAEGGVGGGVLGTALIITFTLVTKVGICGTRRSSVVFSLMLTGMRTLTEGRVSGYSGNY